MNKNKLMKFGIPAALVAQLVVMKVASAAVLYDAATIAGDIKDTGENWWDNLIPVVLQFGMYGVAVLILVGVLAYLRFRK